ncbi:MAG TPA: MaoC/PaaZ C-terminal domain-containing protein [Steroidobacteraceae bacterium]|jgi:acyl dehydratase|nr:MaoC/PaaZ C-terminal domain-containing protein [Steroidobacteraceae bacterium]
MRYFEDLIEGDERLSEARQVTEAELLEFARSYDPQYFHADPQAASRSVFGGLIASGIFTMAVWRQLDHRICGDVAWICGVGWDDVRFPKPVRPGDWLRARALCLSKRPSQKDPHRGVVVFEYTLLNQLSEAVFRCRSTNLVERRPAGSDSGAAAG